MRIACPACGAAYEVPDRLIGAGRLLRCAKCGHEWLVRPAQTQEPAGTAPPVAAPPPGPARDLPPPHPASRRPPQVIEPPLPQFGDAVPQPPRKTGLWLGWILSILVLLLLAASVLMFRAEIIAAWPPAARFYAALGLDSGR
jgi:predicted Zn finger-like uncharacterized protein